VLPGVSLCWLGTGFCCSPCVACRGSIPCSVPCSGPRTERACLYPFPRGGCRASQGESSELCPSIPTGPYRCCYVCCFAGVVRSNRRGGLGAPWTWMMCVSMFPSVRLAALVSSGRLRVRLRVGILRFARPCARGVICDASGAEAGFSPGRCFAALLCSILCWYQDNIPRACRALCSQSSVLPQSEARGSVEKAEDAKRWVFRLRFVRSRSAGSPFLVMHTWCPPVWVG